MNFPDVAWFKKNEFRCKCGCGLDWRHIDPRIIELADQIRNIHGAPVTVLSSCRCSRHNTAVKGSRHSRHIVILGKCDCDALDITIGDLSRFDGFVELCQEVNCYGHTIYYPRKHFVHIDLCGERKTYKGA